MMPLLQEFVSKNARLRSDDLMIQDGAESISYGQMDRATNKLARYLIGKGVKRKDCVSLLLPKCINLFKSMIAILKADATYVPLNLQTPVGRNRFILEQSQCRFLCCDQRTEAHARDLIGPMKGVTLIVITNDLETSENDTPLTYQNAPDDLAYVLYTSGSTGFPKGVMISHGSVINYASWAARHLNIKPNDRLSNQPGLFFDLSVFDIYSAFISGASLHLVPQHISVFPVKIVDFIETNKLTIWNSVPSLYTYIVRAKALKAERLAGLRILTFNGEVMPTPTVIAWMLACPHARFINQYGPTETTCASLYHEIRGVPTDPAVSVAIGQPIANTRVYALNEYGREAAIGEIGELHILGAGLGKGYLHDAEKTAKAYIRDPLNTESGEVAYATGDLVKQRSDGSYEYICRKDHQVKVMGFRVELGEIESCLNALDYISASAALALAHSQSGDDVIVAFIVMKEEEDKITDTQIKKDLGTAIPHYMMPRIIVRLQEMPINANGKIDRHELKKIYLSGNN